MIVKFSDYEIITPDLVEKIKKALSASPEYTEAIFSKRVWVLRQMHLQKMSAL